MHAASMSSDHRSDVCRPRGCGCVEVTVELIYRAALEGARCWARNDRGHVRALPMSRWIGGPGATHRDRFADEHMLQLCSGRATLDLGCGPGRFTASLQQRGSPARGVNNCRAAVKLPRQRGGAAIHADLFGPLPAAGCWDRILLTDGNIGIGGNPWARYVERGGLSGPGGAGLAETNRPSWKR